ncbi:MAG: type II secretion system protein GspF [Deltaproteobacteria bacterium]|nr:MAG: type II secretion system protein GspF [Deltaproteobacteria bacterium]
MSLYSYKATDISGKIAKGTLEAPDEKGAADRLHDMGYIPIRISQTGKGRGKLAGSATKSGDPDILSFFTRVSTKDVMLFTQDLSALLEAGLPVDRALSILTNITEKEKFREIIRDVLKAVQGGSYLSDAMAKHPGAFSAFYVNMVRAGEAGGVLEAVLERLGIFLESSQDLRDYIKSALVYPVFLVFVGGISIIILMTFVIPKFSIIFSDMGHAIPLSTRLLLGLSEELRTFWWMILAGLSLVYFLIWRYVKTPTGRFRMDSLKMRFPVSGNLVRKIEIARFSRTLGTLIKSGVPILEALDLVKDIISNRVIAGSMGEIYERVKKGERLSKPLGDIGIFPSLAVQMITVGEESGRLDEMLLRVAENYEKTVRNIVKRFISLLEPAMILVMGLVVGFIVISMLMAIFSMNEMPF